jgi:hypothetical protein
VMHPHRRLVDVRLERGVVVGQGRDLVGHLGFLSWVRGPALYSRTGRASGVNWS